MNNKYLYIGNDLIAGPVKMDNPEEQQYSYSGAYKAAMDSYSNHIASLPKIEVVKEPTHSWEINKILVEGQDVEIQKQWYSTNYKEWLKATYDDKWYKRYERKTRVVAIPIKLNTQYSEQNYSKGEMDLLASDNKVDVDSVATLSSSSSNSDEQEQPEEEFTPCELCDGHPACEDFGCFLDIFSDKD